MPKLKAFQATTTLLSDPSVPLAHKKAVLGQLCMDEGPESTKIVQSILKSAAEGNGEAVHAAKVEELNQLMQEIRSGPLRSAIYLDRVPKNGSSVERVQVLLENGDSTYPVVADRELAESLRAGDNVLLDAQARVLLFRGPEDPRVGEEARLERCLDDRRIEAVLRNHEPYLFRVSDSLSEKIREGRLEPGSRLVVCSRRSMAFDAVPHPEGFTRFRHLVRDWMPDIIISRDVGNPPPYIFELLEHLRTEMEVPELGRRYRVRRARTKFLCGVSGSGKTLSILALWRAMYELMAELTGAPIDGLPPRVFRLRMPQVLSKWLGDSDKNLDRFFNEVEEVAAEPFVAPDGTRHELPVLVICEEIDGLARTRGTGDEVYDRIQTTALERLDVNSERLRDRLVVFIFTSNVARLVDPAFVRRAGGTMEQFGRLSRRGFQAVLEKHLRDLPLRAEYGSEQRDAERRVVGEVCDWLYSPDGNDPGQVELTYVGSSAPVVKFRRDFLTGALIDRAVQQAAAEACHAERRGVAESGLTSQMIMAALDRQVRSIVDLLSSHNSHDYVTLPDGVRVGDVRRIERAAIEPFDLERRES